MHLHINKILLVNIFSFFIALSYATILYSGSTYLSSVFGTGYIWIIYSVAAVLTIFLNFSITKILRRLKMETVTNTILYLAFFNLIILYFTESFLNIGFTFILYVVFAEFLLMLSSIMTEDLSKDNQTGIIRGRFISIQSLGYLLAPVVASFLISLFSIKEIFLTSSFFILIAFIIFKFYIQSIPKITIHDRDTLHTLKKVFRKIDIRNIIIAQIGLTTFYSLAVIYIPFKMAEVGISLSQYLGILLPFALLPFLFVPNILGHLEDEMKNEKEILIFAYLGLILSICMFAFVDSSSIFIWGVILFISRVFASSTETSISSYLFKKIDQSDTAIISIFSSAQSISYLIFTPFFAYLYINSDIEIVFLSVSFLLCFVLVLISNIHDTKNYEKHERWRSIWQKAKKRSQKVSG